MKRDRITPGIILLLIGAAILLRNFGYLHFHWTNILHLWPIFLVIGGVNLIFANNRSIWASAVKITVVVIGLALVLFGDFGNRYNFPHFVIGGHHYNHDMDDDDDDNDDSDTTANHGLVKVDGNSFYTAPFATAIKVGKLSISGGGNSFKLSDTTNQLFTANVKSSFARYEMSNHTQDSVSTVNFRMRNGHKNHWDWSNDDKGSTAIIKLNSAPEWEMKIEAGATDLDFDLSRFKIRNLDLSGGAASFKVKLGEPTAANTQVKLSSGVSDITVKVPKDAACSIISSTGLSSNSFDGFNKTSDNHYETAGFGSAKNKIYINISGGMSNFNVSRY